MNHQPNDSYYAENGQQILPETDSYFTGERMPEYTVEEDEPFLMEENPEEDEKSLHITVGLIRVLSTLAGVALILALLVLLLSLFSWLKKDILTSVLQLRVS